MMSDDLPDPAQQLFCYGLAIEVNEHLAGGKNAVVLGGRLIVSPAMWALMKDATEAELLHLLKHLPIVNLGTPPLFYMHPNGKA